MSYRTLFPMIAAIVTIGFGAGSQAAPAADLGRSSDFVSVRVNLADLDLGDRSGAEVGLQRIRRAASEICGPSPYVGDLALEGSYRACLATAIDGAVDRLGKPTVSALDGRHPSMVRVASGR